jgi:Peptidase family M28
MRSAVISLAILLMAKSVAADKRPYPIFRVLDQKSVDALLLSVPQSNQLRLAQLKKAFDDVECRGSDLQVQSTGDGANLSCTLVGRSKDTILVAAHYERVGEGMSAVDDWSGAIMLPFLYRALSATQRHYTFMFAALSGNDESRLFLKSLTKAQQHAIRAVVALDALGLGTMRFYIHQSNSAPSPAENFLRAQLFEAADNDGLKPPESSIPDSWFRIDDTKEFRYHGIPAILMHSVDRSKRELPGSRNDKPDAIDRNAYFDSYKTLCYYLVGLDQMPDSTAAQVASPSRGRR